MAFDSVIALPGCGAPGNIAAAEPIAGDFMPEQIFSDSDDDRRIKARVGDVVEIRLSENATTGYRWSPDDVDPAIIALVDSGSDYPGSAMGSGGTAIFRFRIRVAGAAAIKLIQWRSWEGPRSIIKRFTLWVDAG